MKPLTSKSGHGTIPSRAALKRTILHSHSLRGKSFVLGRVLCRFHVHLKEGHGISSPPHLLSRYEPQGEETTTTTKRGVREGEDDMRCTERIPKPSDIIQAERERQRDPTEARVQARGV